MKRINKWLVSLLAVVLVSCTDDFQEINQDERFPTVVDPAYILSGIQIDAMERYVYTSDLFNNQTGGIVQYFVKHLYTNENVYNFRGSMFDAYWGRHYNALARIREAAEMVETPPYHLTDEGTKINQKAIFEILEVWTWTQITDQFGDVPYTDALTGLDGLQPSYTPQSEIYPDLINRLSNAMADINGSGSNGSFGDSDLFLNGDASAWARFANSLKLRLGMRIIDANPTLGGSTVSEALDDPLISSYEESVQFSFGKTTNRSPLRRTNDGGSAGWEDVVACKTFTDIVNDRNDPRRSSMLYDWSYEPYSGYPVTDVAYPNLESTEGGGRWGWAYLGWNFRSYDRDESDGVWPHNVMDFAEVSFLLAEAVERGFASPVGQTAEEHYIDGVTSSMRYHTYYGDGWQTITDVDIAAYLAQPNVAYSNAASGTTWQEKIGIQKYIAFYPYGSEAFSEQRRLDFPVLTPPTKGGVQMPASEIPTRLPYPNNEVLLNSDNTAVAIDRIGGENSMTVKVWWDVN
ncbi:SusD/RagB family nutrient-binding outer membrane lipoprotein [Reichenbachiella sp.]|uniref:SusD/RagB family nutrient-binding outer membrane lipoprotein n=1 Tax=Reichenbachiella sp. TaxID=2184521 RepID=UPI003B58D7D1